MECKHYKSKVKTGVSYSYKLFSGEEIDLCEYCESKLRLEILKQMQTEIVADFKGVMQ